MKQINIKQKLEEIGVALDGIIMGDFDRIGEFTAKRERKPDDPNYKKYGAFYRANYERGILIYYLIRQFNLSSMLEIGFGRGFATFCAARAFHDAGVQGKIVTIDPALDENYIKMLQNVLPQEWFSYITFVKGVSQQLLAAAEPLDELKSNFDLIYVDGDHSYAGVKRDWELVKDKANKFVLMDDYHLPSKNDPGIQCRQAIDEINWINDGFVEPNLIICDRRMFFDDRQLPDSAIDYGQVLFTRPNVSRDDW